MRLPLGLGVLLCVCALPVQTLPAHASASRLGPAADKKRVGPVTEGSLLVEQHGEVVRVPLKHTDVRYEVSGHLVETRVVQTFENPAKEKIEAVYLFPLPTGAAVHGFVLRSGTRVVRGRLLERREAKAVYERASRAGKVAALLTEERPNLFVQSVANLEPGRQVSVELRFSQALVYTDGGWELVFPMVVGPRFSPRRAVARPARPDAEADPAPTFLPPALRSSHEIDLRVELEAGLPIEGLRSPSHKIETKRPSASSAEVTLARGDRIPNKDFVLRYEVAGPAPRAAFVVHREAGTDGSLLLVVQPPAPRSAAAKTATPRELVVVLDASSSMSGAPLAKAKEIVRALLERVGAEDTFQIVRFSDQVSSLGPKMIAPRPANRTLALSWLERVQASGGTYLADGLRAALEIPHDPARLRHLVLVTDGFVANEDEILALLAARIGAARVSAIGVGSAVNRYLLEEAAGLGRGRALVVRHDEPIAAAMARLASRLEHPLLTDLTVAFEQRGARRAAVHSLLPVRLPDLYAGEPLFLLGRFSGEGEGELVVRGRRLGEPAEIRVPLRLPAVEERHRAVAMAWGRARIAEEERALLRRDDPATRERILELSLAHGILTRFTSFVAVDESSRTEGKAAVRVRVPLERPDGVLGVARGGGGLGMLGSGGGGGGYGSTIGVGGLGLSGVGYGASVLRSFGTAHVVQAPRIMVGHSIITGGLDKTIIRRAILTRQNEVRTCYAAELGSSPGLEGRVTVELTIDENGRVVSATVAESTLASPPVQACVLAAMKKLTFPRTTGGGIVVVRYPFLFKPAEKAAKAPPARIEP
jgi:Ca-activated chloride channel homolog